jgi:predicted amidophosphoribosyltransferase
MKTSSTKTQVFKKREARWQQYDGVFTTQNEERLRGKHILMVDDIITTGATMEACANVLTKTHNNKLSIATMAIA